MKYAKRRWMGAVAICLGFASPTWADPNYFPDNSPFVADEDGEAAVSIRQLEDDGGAVSLSDASGSIRMGKSASGSIAATGNEQAQYLEPPADFTPTVQSQINRPMQPVFQDPGPALDGSVGYAQTKRLNEILWRLGRVNGDQYGFNGGYTNFNAFVPIFDNGGTALTWINPRIIVTDYGAPAANVGIGQRFYDQSRDRVYGGSFWYDYDDGHVASYNQLGGSFENIGQYVSFRSNFTVPVGTRSTVYNVQNVAGGTNFVGSNISILQSFQKEVALQQYDAEVAVPMPIFGAYGFDLGLGMYGLYSPDINGAVGGSVRTQAQITENVWMNGIYTYDHVFKSVFSLNLELTMPNGKAAHWFRRAPVSSYMTQSVQRRYRVPARTGTGTQTILATQNGVVVNVAFIDPNANTDPTSFDSIFDFDNAANKSSYQLIYTLGRTDNTDTNLNTGITLSDNQIFVGQGLNRSVTTDQGVVQLPSSSGPAPILSNSGAANPLTPVITLANNNEVVGFTIDGGNTADAIFGSGIQSFNVHDNTLRNVINGINITTNTAAGSTSYGIAENNVITGNINTDNLYPSLAGISVVHNGAGTLDLLIRNNTITGFDEDANQNGILNNETTANLDQDFDGIIDADEDLNMNAKRDGIGIQVIAQRGRINASNPTATGGTTGILNNTVTASANGISAIVAPTTAAGATMDLSMNNNTVSNLTAPLSDGGAAFRLRSDSSVGPSVLNLNAFQGNSTSNNAGDGLAIDVVSNGVINFAGFPTFAGNTLTGNAGTGLLFNIVDSQVELDSLSGLTITGNSGDGLAFNVDGATASLKVLSPMVGSTFTQNSGNGFVVTAQNGATVDLYFGAASSGATAGNLFTNNGATTGAPTGSGLVLNALSGSRINTALVGNTFTGNKENGAVLNALGGTIDLTGPATAFTAADGSVLLTSGIVGGVNGSSRTQNFTGNGANGLAILSSNGGAVNVPFMNGNSFNDNTGAGLLLGSVGGIVTPAASTIRIDSAVANQFNRTTSGTSGILFDTENVNVTLTNLLRNEFIGSTTNTNTAFGIGGNVNGGGLNLELVTPSNADRNTFSNNVGAHIGLVFEKDSVNTIQVNNGTFTNALANADLADDFNGDGIALIGNETSKITGNIVNSRFTGNAGDGIKIVLGGANSTPTGPLGPYAQLNNFVISNNVVGTTTAGEGNGMNGINIERNARGNINNLTVSNNSAEGNINGAGLRVVSGGADYLDVGRDTFYAYGNNFSSNLHGIELKVVADADMVANLGFAQGTNPDNATAAQRNFMENNLADGILAWEQVNNVQETRSISGQWTNNIIRNNVDDGIDFRTNAGDPSTVGGLNGGLIIGNGAVNTNLYGTTSVNGNLITLNGRDGIDITGGGLYTIRNNNIVSNGRLTQTTNVNQDDYYLGVAGVNITGSQFETGSYNGPGNGDISVGIVPVPPSTNTTYQYVILQNNLISMNNGDGVQWIDETSKDSIRYFSGSQLDMSYNAVNNNTGRGIDLLMRPADTDPTDSDNTDPDVGYIQGQLGVPPVTTTSAGYVRGVVNINDNQIAGNKQEGVYLVTTNATSQTAARLSYVDLEMDGSIGAAYYLNFNFSRNQVIGNGSSVISFPATGLVMRIGTTDGGYGNQFQDGFASDGMGGVIAVVTDNIFTGNLGDDIVVHSFTSTVNPPTTGGNWSATEFTPNNYFSDPLARLDLTFSGNTADSVTFNNAETGLTPNGEAGAYYNNSDPFKSRLGPVASPPTPAGPFTSNTRRRNATRLQSDWRTNPNDPSTGNLPPFPPDTGASWQYSGMGSSTMRVNYGANTIGGVLVTNVNTLFAVDFADPITSNADINFADDIPFTGNNLIGELPFGWGTF